MAYRISKQEQSELEYKLSTTSERCSQCSEPTFSMPSTYTCGKIGRRVNSGYVCKYFDRKVKIQKKPGTKRIIKGLENELRCTRDGEVYYYRISDRGNRILIFNTKYNKLNFLFGLSREAFDARFEKV